ncbi:MAG: T9SS type A sorting domain-containing protein, partial [Rhodothermales bacterium]
YRSLQQVDALGRAGVRASGLWRSQGTAWTVTSEADVAVARSALVLEPIDLPTNTDGMRFVLKHRYHLGDGLGGNVKISVDGGAWQVIEPEEAYAATLEDAGNPMAGEPVLRGTRDDATATFDLTAYSGAQIRFRVDLGAGRPLEPDEFWTLQEANVFLSTASPDGFETPRELALHPNFPNPFSGSTTISYTLPEAMPVRLEVYDLLGRRVAVLAEGDQAAATYTVPFDGSALASGVYLLRLRAGGMQRTKRMVVAR